MFGIFQIARLNIRKMHFSSNGETKYSRNCHYILQRLKWNVSLQNVTVLGKLKIHWWKL